ncbi:hypothetical protein RB195_022886 [Necator americanus]|uniref:Helitron helicase-like domain-containing protein n=1 Tax=Necator americanus TaxID=51031 RepID=A0ABR1EJ61_NECAM
MTSSLRQQAVRQNESAERRSERLAANSLRQHRRRQAETVEERSERLFENAQRQQRRRQTEGAEERAVRLSENAQRQHRRRENEDAARRSERLILNGKRQRRQSLNDGHEHRIHRLHADAERQRRRRRAPLETIGLALRTRTAETNYLGEMNCRCMNCGARHFQFEVKQQYPGIFGDYCNHDRIVFDLFEKFQEPLKQLFLRESSASLEHRQRHRNFLENIRNFNSALAIICCDPELMRFLSEWFAQNNAYARSFKMMSEVERAEKEAANRDNRRPTTIRMVFEENSGRNIARGQYAMPTANEVAVVYVGEENDVPPARSLAVSLRESDGTSLMNISDMDKSDEWVAPTNLRLFTKFNCHVNVEICGTVSAVKYLYKYIYKGPDRARITIESDSDDSGNGVVDEIKQHLNTRCVCPPQALHRMFEFAMQEKSHAVCRLAVHLPGYQTVHFVAGQKQQAVDSAHSNFTSLTAYFELNRSCANVFDNGLQSDTNIDARELFYYQIPEHFSFTARHGWKPRRRGVKEIGCMYTVSPRDVERYSLRILLLNTKGKMSFQDLRTVDGRTYEKFSEATKASGFLDDDTYYRQSIQEAAQFQIASTLHNFFACLLCYCELANAEELWTEFSASMADDFTNMGGDPEDAIAAAYFDIADRMLPLGRD